MKKIRLIAFVAAFLVFITGYRILVMREDDQNTGSGEGKEMEVLVAAKYIGPYTTVTQDMVKFSTVPVGKEAQGYYTNPEDVVGKVCISDIYQEEAFTSVRLAEEDAVVLGLAGRLEEGKRAVSIEVDSEQGVSNQLRVGNRVDIVYTGVMGSIPGMDEGLTAGSVMEQVLGPQNPANTQIMHHYVGNEISFLAMQDIKVAALGNKFFFDTTEDYTSQEYVNVTLEVTPAQAAQIALMKSGEGKLQLLLRPQEDSGIVNEPRGTVMQNYEGN